MIVLDSSAVYAVADADDRHHEAAVAAVTTARGALVIPAAIVAEIAYMVESRLGDVAMDTVLADIVDGRYACEFDGSDMARVRDLLRQYRDLHLGVADASVIACAERYRSPVLTFDRRDFDVVARAGTLQVIP